MSSLLRLFGSYNNSPPLPSTVLFDISILLPLTVVLFTLLGILILFLCKRMSFTCEVVSV